MINISSFVGIMKYLAPIIFVIVNHGITSQGWEDEKLYTSLTTTSFNTENVGNFEKFHKLPF